MRCEARGRPAGHNIEVLRKYETSVRAILTTRGRMSSPRALPLVCELRASPDLRARPVCVAASRESDHVVLGYENGAVAAWRAADFPLPEEASRVLSSGAVAARPSWVVAELEGSGGDGCPVDALALLPACLAHPSGAVAVAHGGISADDSRPGYLPRPARVAVLDLETGREARVLDLPMAWPDGGVCPIARLAAAGSEGGVVAVSAARVSRVGEGARGFQGASACMAVWGAGSPVPVAVVQAGPKHAPALGQDPSALPRDGSPRKLRERLRPEPILAPFAGLSVFARAREDGGDGDALCVRAAHAVVSLDDGALRLCYHEWHLAQPATPAGCALRPTKLVEMPSFALGERSPADAMRLEAERRRNPDLPRTENVEPSPADPSRGAPAVATWEWGCAAAWAGCAPRANAWRLHTASAPDEFAPQPSVGAALERVAAGPDRKIAAIVPAPALGRVFLLAHDDDRARGPTRTTAARLFVTRAGEASEEERSTERLDEAEVGEAREAREAEGDEEPCPICLEPPGTSRAARATRDEPPATNPFAAYPAASAFEDERARREAATRVACCGMAFCRECLVDYVANFPAGGCPHCRDVAAFGAERGGGRFRRGAEEDAAAPWREIALDALGRVVAETGPPGATVTLPESMRGDLAEDFLRPVSGSSSAAAGRGAERRTFASDVLAPDFLVGARPPEAEPMADGPPPVGNAGLGADFFRADRVYGTDPPPENMSDDFLRGLAPSDLVAGPGASGEWESSRRESSAADVAPAAPSFVGSVAAGYAASSAPPVEDETLARCHRVVAAVDDREVGGRLVVLTARGAAVFDASAEATAALFADERR